MNGPNARFKAPQRGMTLVAALLLLLVITMLGVGMFRSFGLEEHLAGNTREKQRALHSAETAEAYAEWWLASNGGINATVGTSCGKGLVSADAGLGQVCSNTLPTVVTNVAVVPWLIGGGEAAVTYTPPGMTAGTNALNTYFEIPRFYISFIGGTFNATAGAQINTYLIDATGYGGTPNAVAVVETGYTVSTIYTTQSSDSKFVNLGGP
jgi:type IV pilus assembly protein PilX